MTSIHEGGKSSKCKDRKREGEVGIAAIFVPLLCSFPILVFSLQHTRRRLAGSLKGTGKPMRWPPRVTRQSPRAHTERVLGVANRVGRFRSSILPFKTPLTHGNDDELRMAGSPLGMGNAQAVLPCTDNLEHSRSDFPWNLSYIRGIRVISLRKDDH